MLTPTRAAWLALTILATAVAWTVASSCIFLLGTHLWAAFAWPERGWAWWIYRPYASNPVVALWLHRSFWGGLGTVVLVPGAVIYRLRTMPKVAPLRWRPRQVERGSSDNHGHAAWMALPELRQLFPGPDPKHGGVVVGEAYRVDQDTVSGARFDPRDRRSWGQGGRTPLLIDPCRDGSTHSLIFAGSGGFKTTTAVTTLLHWTGSVVVLDPSCELAPMLHDARKGMGHRVVGLSPATPDIGLNVLDWIDITAPLAESHVQSVVSWVCGEPSRDSGEEGAFFDSWGRQLVACLLADMLWDKALPAEHKTLRLLRKAVVQPEKKLKARFAAIHRDSGSPMARDIAGSLMDMAAEETFSGIYANAAKLTGWLSIRAYADLVSGSTFRTADLANGHLSVFIQIPLDALLTTPGPARALVGALLNAVYRAEGSTSGRVLFLLDEAARLGRMAVLQQARDAGRKYGITLQLLYQSAGQLEDAWGQHEKRAWYDSVSWRAYAAVRDEKTARELSDAFGTYGVIAYSEGDNAGRHSGQSLAAIGGRSRGQNTNRHEIKRRLIAADELLQDTRADELFIIAGGRPIRCGRAIYFRRPEAEAVVQESRFAA
ncbi:MAG TPA: type IV secretory system conjugative DNA transfer family protein [Acetobacteraceae bacterium]|nr:type IV secretory system conjugative DNA transfer family protein [Acetobacteraceae bacterium]